MPELLKIRRIASNAAARVIAPASYAAEERLNRGIDALRAFGLTPQLGTNALKRGPSYFAGSHPERLEDLHAAFQSDAAALFSIRGGYGSNYLLDGLDLALIKHNPKPFFCYSDLTALQMYLLDQLGLPAFHGPMVAADFGVYEGVHLPSLRAALSGEPYSIEEPDFRTLQSGTAEGILYGGCLSILVAMLGTPYEPQTEGKLLFLEDVGAKPYQIDRMLWQLRAAGKLFGVKGIIFGEMLDCVVPGTTDRIGSHNGSALEETIRHTLDWFDGPVAIGLRSGHVSHSNITLTLGVRARLTAENDNTQLELLESAVG